MSLKFHVNPQTGDPGPCRALSNCPFGGDEVHYDSLSSARAGYESSMKALGFETLTTLSEQRSEWRSIPWDERKALLNKFARTLMSKTSVKKRRRLIILWEDDFLEKGKLGGAAFLDEDPKKTPQIRLPEKRIELLEENSAYEDILHEIAHLQAGMKEEHNENWRAAAKELASKAGILEWHDFPKGSELSPQERFRLNKLWYERRVPAAYGICQLNSKHVLTINPHQHKHPTCNACDDEGEDGYLQMRWTDLKEPEARKEWILDMIRRERII